MERHREKKNHVKGYDLYAIDGDQFDLPASDDILNHHFRGYPAKHDLETHYPKMYFIHVLDLANNIISDFAWSSLQEESGLAQSIVQDYSEKSIFVYDRLHCGLETFLAHKRAGNHFIVRARTRSNGTHREVEKFVRSKKRSAVIGWSYAWQNTSRSKECVEVRLMKVRNPKTKIDEVYVTSLPESEFSNNEIAQIYKRRWEIETSFKDLTFTLKANQWHSRKMNGVLQEMFVQLWLINSVRAEMNRTVAVQDPFEKVYLKSNFKICAAVFVDNLKMLIRRKLNQFRKIFDFWVHRTRESRTHLSRSYPRVVKHRGREYPPANAVKRRKTPELTRLTERH